MKQIKTWVVKLVDGTAITLDDESYTGLIKADQKKGSHRPKWQAPDLTWIFLNKIVGIFPGEVEEGEDSSTEEDESSEEQGDDEEEAPQNDQKLMEELLEKSSCQHKPEDAVLYKQFVRTKNGMGQRYFNLCGFCGQRGRYVKTDSLSDEEKTNAIVWNDKE
jgi:hypothetical protein